MSGYRRLWVATATAVCLLGWPQPAGSIVDTHGDAEVNGEDVVVRASEVWLPVGSEGAQVAGCFESWDVVRSVEDDFVQPVSRHWTLFNRADAFTHGVGEDIEALPDVDRVFSPTGVWYHVNCDGDVRLVPEGGPPIAVEALVLRAVNSMRLPEPVLLTAPSVDAPRITRMEDWLAVDPGQWTQRSATASTGRVWVSVSTMPVRVEWDMGDGEVVVCDGPGRVWTPLVGSLAQSDCTYSYTWSSRAEPGGVFVMTTSMFFEPTVSTNTPGEYLVGELVRSTSVPVVVNELLVKNIEPGSAGTGG